MEIEYIKDKPTPYRINIGDEIKVNRFDVVKNDKIYPLYWTTISKKEFGNKVYYRKSLRFKKEDNIKDGTKIKILNMFEDAMKNHKDSFNPIWCLFILEYEVVEEKDGSDTKAMMDYQQNIAENKEDNIYDDLIVF